MSDRKSTPFSKVEKDLCRRVSRAHQKNFKVVLKRERDKTRLTRDKPGDGTPMFVGQCASEVLRSAL